MLSLSRDPVAADLLIAGEDCIAVRISEIESAPALKMISIDAQLDTELKHNGAKEGIVVPVNNDLNDLDREPVRALIAPGSMPATGK